MGVCPCVLKRVRPQGTACREGCKSVGNRQPEPLSRTPKQAPSSLLAPQTSPWVSPGGGSPAATHPERRSGCPCPWAPSWKCSACTADWVPRRTNCGSGGRDGRAAMLGGGAVTCGPREGMRVTDPPVCLQKSSRKPPWTLPTPFHLPISFCTQWDHPRSNVCHPRTHLPGTEPSTGL